MDPLRRTLVSLLVIAVALGATWEAIRRAAPPPQPPLAESRPVLALSEGQIEAFSVRSWQGAFTARRGAAGWSVMRLTLEPGVIETIGGRVSAPRTAEQIDVAVAEFVTELVALPEVDAFARGNEPWSAFGLDKPGLAITLELARGEAIALEIGDTTPGMPGLYARVVGPPRPGSAARAAPADEVLRIGTLFRTQVDAVFWRLRGLAEG